MSEHWNSISPADAIWTKFVEEQEHLPQQIEQSEMVEGNQYYVLTDLGELSPFKYIGNDKGVNILFPCGNKSFLIPTDEVFKI